MLTILTEMQMEAAYWNEKFSGAVEFMRADGTYGFIPAKEASRRALERPVRRRDGRGDRVPPVDMGWGLEGRKARNFIRAWGSPDLQAHLNEELG